MTYSWTNEDGEPIMSGEAWRFEQQLDMDSAADYYADDFYNHYDEPDEDDCNHDGCDLLPNGIMECSWCGVTVGTWERGVNGAEDTYNYI